jgi:hypothetical protein
MENVKRLDLFLDLGHRLRRHDTTGSAPEDEFHGIDTPISDFALMDERWLLFQLHGKLSLSQFGARPPLPQ